ncbi:hypothetical protein B9Z19DRAFT_1121831 [Tuber borchii]|uniref:Uncharacterized protein n=1 Tax=Tuber borchii TaxID=42251 RepID=A0A2T7A1R8_TUBBO|nr:hypothetical protein B9Z19DRAFT_1121831 [Tuber borchii]
MANSGAVWCSLSYQLALEFPAYSLEYLAFRDFQELQNSSASNILALSILPGAPKRERVLPFSLAISLDLGIIKISVGAGSATTAKGVTTSTKRATTSTRRAITASTKKATTTTKGVTTTVSSPPKPTTTRMEIPAPAGVDCSDPSWEPTVDAWMAEDVDQKLKGWWESIPDRTSKNFVSEFGGAFGDFAHNLACGVDTEDQCVNPSCKVFLDANAPKWTYFVRVAISNLNRNMRLIHDGIGDGQMDFEALREDVAQSFLPWKDSRTKLQKAAPWITAALSTIAGFVPLGAAVGGVIRILPQALAAGASTAGAAFGGGVFAEIAQDPAIKPIIQRMVQLKEMGKFVADYCSTAREILGNWSTVIFSGGEDKSGSDIFVYLRGGRFVLHDEWTRSDLENFFKKRLVAWFVNSEIRAHTKTFILCANSTDPESVVCPSEAKYITSNGTRVCSLYRLNDKGELKDLIAVDKLKQPQYNITAQDMIQSSVEVYLANGLNYTAEDLTSRLETSATLPSDQQWFAQGAAGEGAFTIPVCDVGDHTELMGSAMPCCCGVGCQDTKSFMESANMGSFNPVEKKCEEIFDGSETVDYGSNTPLSKPSWRVLAGVFFAIVVANFLLD